MQDNEALSSYYQALVENELDLLSSLDYDFQNERSFLTSQKVIEIVGADNYRTFAHKGLLIDFGNSRLRTAHTDLFFRLVNIRSFEEQRPIPLEFRIVKKKEIVPDYNRYKLPNVIDDLVRNLGSPSVLSKIILDSIPEKFQGLSSYQFPMINGILSGKYETAAIVAPTASGKTLTFFLPVFMRAIKRSLDGTLGTSSVLIYPRLALGKDQLQNFLKFIDKANEILGQLKMANITIGIDDRDTPRKSYLKDGASFRKLKCVRCEQSLILKVVNSQPKVVCPSCRKDYDYIITNKEDIWSLKPKILITNIWAIYRRLLSSNTVDQFRNLDNVVIDEAHVYTHFLGGHVSYILRLLRFVTRESKPVFIFSSATIPNPKDFVANLSYTDKDSLFFIDFKEALEKAGGEKSYRLLLYLYLLPHPDSNVETLSEEVILATGLWAHKHNVKAITFIDSVAEINTMRDYLHSTILGSRKGREVVDHLVRTDPSPANDYNWSTLSPLSSTDQKILEDFIMNDYKNSVQMHYGGLSLEKRACIENDFSKGKIKLLLSTSTLELGIDLSDVGAVIQHKLPLADEGVVQRVGRSGRSPSCYRTSMGIVVLPTLPLSTLYMYNDNLRERLESVAFLPPLKIGQASLSLSLQYTLSMILLKRAIEKKPTYIDLSKEGIAHENQLCVALNEILLELKTLKEFNFQLNLIDNASLEYSIESMRKLIQPIVTNIQLIKSASLHKQVDELAATELRVQNCLIASKNADEYLVNICEKISRIDIFSSNTIQRIFEISENLRILTAKLSELTGVIKQTIEYKDQRIVFDWLEKNREYIERISSQLPNGDDISAINLELLLAVGKFGFPKFRAKYRIDGNEITSMVSQIGTIFGVEERQGLISLIKELPNRLDSFSKVDYGMVSTYTGIERFKEGVQLTNYRKLDIFEALSLLLEGKAHFSLLLKPPAPDFELVGMGEL